MSHRKGTYTKQNAAAELLAHLQSLGLETPEDYRQWCVENGFRTSFRKSRFQRREELLYFRRQMAVNSLRQRKQEQRSIVDKLEAVCSKEVSKKSITDPVLRMIWQLHDQESPCINHSEMTRDSFMRLVSHLYCSKTKFILDRVALTQQRYPWGVRYIDALVFIASKASYWIRPIETWKPRGTSARRQFSSLLRHLFVKYQMPRFFDSVWLVNYTPECEDWREWYLEVGQGQNIRNCRLPVSYSKKMAHFFMQAPQDLTILQALRWGQVLGMGGDPGLGRAIMQSPFPKELSNDQFWTTVIQWLIHHASLDRRQIQSIVEFLRYQRFGVFTIPGDNGVYDEVDAPAPDYSIKGRTPRSLLRDVADWHREQEQKSKIPECTWDASGIREFDFEDENRWMIREILTSDDLVTEGNQMKHCVASYIGNCTGGESSIWSMQIELQQGFKKAITIEVRKDNNLISEVRGKANRLPNPRERNVLRRWAETAGLKFSRYVNV